MFDFFGSKLEVGAVVAVTQNITGVWRLG